VEVVSEPARPEVQEVVLRQVLGELLAEVRTPFPNLSRVASRDETRGLGSLVTELEAALVPVNRRAAKRSLSRLSRETHRALERGLIVPEVSPSDALEPEAQGSAANMGPQVPPEEDAVTPHWAASPEVTARAMFAAPAPSHRVSPPAPAPA